MKTTQMKSAIARITGACAGIVLAALLCVASCKKPDVLPSSVSVTPSSATITEGETANFSASVLPADAVYSIITWSSSDTKVATVNNGVVTGVKAGSATITASADGVSGSATVTVIAKIIAVTGVSLDKAELALTEGEEAQLKATVAPDNATDKSVSWKSADEKVATVSSDGKVTAVAPGETIITVTTADGGKTATCKVIVNAKLYPVESVSLDKTELVLTEGGEEQLTATIAPENASNKNVSWSSSDEAVATVSSEGKVTAVKAGTATITVTTEDGGKTATCAVTVNAKVYPVTGVSLNKTSLTLTEGDNAQLTATVKPENASNKKVTWKSSDNTIATVSSEGKVTAVKAGTATITVTTEDGGKTAKCTVTVKAKTISVTGVTLNKTALTLTVGGSEQLTATVKPDNASNKSVTWSSSNTSVATVSSSGKVTAVKAGTSTITVKTVDGSKTAKCTVTVLPEGALPGVFSVSATKKVRFAKGNLQATYNGSKYKWGFADSQYDFVGKAVGNTTIDSQTSGAVVDLFGWSTDATNYGISTATSISNYSGGFVDWGKNIGDGSTWRTLSKDEWTYLFRTRTNASKLYKYGVTVCGKTKCLIIAPDGFTGTIAASYDAAAWATAEAAGLVCLPAAGYRYGSSVYDVGDYGDYWSSSASGSNYAYYVYFSSGDVSPDDDGRGYGHSVRLITESK